MIQQSVKLFLRVKPLLWYLPYVRVRASLLPATLVCSSVKRRLFVLSLALMFALYYINKFATSTLFKCATVFRSVWSSTSVVSVSALSLSNGGAAPIFLCDVQW